MEYVYPYVNTYIYIPHATKGTTIASGPIKTPPLEVSLWYLWSNNNPSIEGTYPYTNI
jgi:hypothetical protein